MKGWNNGLGRIAVNQGALVETLIQLSDFRQYELAEALLAACERMQLEQLLPISARAFSHRMAYSLEKQVKRSNEPTYRPKGVPLAELMVILNTWCAEGHRNAVRCVLGELRPDYLTTLARLPELDREVYSMLREFEPPAPHYHFYQ